MSTNYNDELKKLKEKQDKIIKKAEKDGYKLINGELTKETFQPVIELYARGETDYESYGSFYVFRKVIPLTEEQLEIVKNLEQTKENLVKNFVYDGLLSNLDGIDLFYEILDWGHELSEEYIDRIVEKDDFDEEYSLEDGQNLYLEFFFNNKHNMDGYISVYDMSVEDINKQEEINIFFSKYLTYN